MASNSNRGVVYLKPGVVEVQRIDFRASTIRRERKSITA
jgi:hypothetical protein